MSLCVHMSAQECVAAWWGVRVRSVVMFLMALAKKLPLSLCFSCVAAEAPAFQLLFGLTGCCCYYFRWATEPRVQHPIRTTDSVVVLSGASTHRPVSHALSFVFFLRPSIRWDRSTTLVDNPVMPVFCIWTNKEGCLTEAVQNVKNMCILSNRISPLAP